MRRDKRQRVTIVTRRRSQRLRENATFPEQLLWSKLRGKQLAGLRFRRQHPIEPYIVDFYCPTARLAIKLDGDSHDKRMMSETDMMNSEVDTSTHLCASRLQ
jgi:very-short-patch-repair endonuclease